MVAPLLLVIAATVSQALRVFGPGCHVLATLCLASGRSWIGCVGVGVASLLEQCGCRALGQVIVTEFRRGEVAA